MMQRRRTPGAGCPRERAGSPFHPESSGSRRSSEEICLARSTLLPIPEFIHQLQNSFANFEQLLSRLRNQFHGQKVLHRDGFER
jgi:hypothetical protein